MKRLFCIDLEGTLISNAVSQIPRPGLFSFLEFLREFGDLVIFTSVSPEKTRDIQSLLVRERVVPEWFADLDSLHPDGTIKCRAVAESYAPEADEYYLLDDQFACIAEDEQEWWVFVSEFQPPYRSDALGLAGVESHLLFRMGIIKHRH